MVDWFNALRAARFHYLQVAFPGASDADVSGAAVPLGVVLPSGGWCQGLTKGPPGPQSALPCPPRPREVTTGPLLDGARGRGAGLSRSLPQLVPKLSRNYLKEGYMEKTGPKVGGPAAGLRTSGPWGRREAGGASHPPTRGAAACFRGSSWHGSPGPEMFCKKGAPLARTVGLWVRPQPCLAPVTYLSPTWARRPHCALWSQLRPSLPWAGVGGRHR